MTGKVDIKRIHTDRAALVRLLEGAGAKFKGNSCRCVFHDDKTPSAGVYQKDGEWRFKCQGCGVGGDILDIQNKLTGVSVGDQLREMSGSEKSDGPAPRVFPTIEAMLESVSAYSTVEDHYRYTDPDTGDVDMVVIRCRSSEGKKSFLQGKPAPGGFVMKSPNKPLPIFNRTALRQTQTCIVVEGEKCVKALRSAGWTATTSPGGALNADSADWSPLAGMTVYLWRDFDPNGETYVKAVAAQLANLNPPATVNLVDVEEFGLPEKSDVVEYLEAFGGDSRQSQYAAVESALSISQSCGPSAILRKLIEDTISGKRYAVEWPWHELDRSTNALLPGTVTTICGDPGASKSFLLLQAAQFWHKRKIPVALFQLEADEDGSHLMRAAVQFTGESDMWDWRWIRDNPDRARQIEQDCRPFIDSFGARLWTPPADPPSLEELTEWVLQRAKDKCRVIVIDPISAAGTSNQRWNDDRLFTLNTQRIMRQYGASLVIITHPKLNAKDGAMAEVSGGAAYTRFTHTVLWLKTHEPPKEVLIRGSLGEGRPVVVNRTMKISKARLGRGTGWELAYQFGRGMLFNEVGTVTKNAPSPDDAEMETERKMSAAEADKLARRLASLFPAQFTPAQVQVAASMFQQMRGVAANRTVDETYQAVKRIDHIAFLNLCKERI